MLLSDSDSAASWVSTCVSACVYSNDSFGSFTLKETRTNRWRSPGLTWADYRSTFPDCAYLGAAVSEMPLLWITYFFFLLCRPGSGSGSPNKCDEVRKLFQLTQIGAGQSLPVSPRAGRLGWSIQRRVSYYCCRWLDSFRHVYCLTRTNADSKKK